MYRMTVSDLLALPDANGELMRSVVAQARQAEWYPGLLDHMRGHGQVVPVCVIGGVFRNGGHRLAAAQELGWEQMDVSPDPRYQAD